MSQAICRYIKPLSQPYLDLVSVYTNNNSTELQHLLLKYADVFSRDENTGENLLGFFFMDWYKYLGPSALNALCHCTWLDLL